MLHRLTCFVVIFSILKPVYGADDDGRISVGVIGGGYTGVLSSIFLGRLKDQTGKPVFDVHLFERNLNLMNGASTLCARRHYGGEYPNDKSTAEQCLFSSVLSQQMFPTEAILTGRCRNDFLVARESETIELSCREMSNHYAHLKDLYQVIVDLLGAEEAERQLFGKPEEFFEDLVTEEYNKLDERLRAHFAGGVSTKERGFQPIALGVILERLLAQNNVKVHLGRTVENAEFIADKGYRLHYSSHTKGKQEFFANYVIATAWHENPSLNIIAASRAVPVESNITTKVYLRSIGLFDVSGCANIPQDRSYFGLKGNAGGMVSFYTSAVAAIYIPKEGLSLQGEFEVTYEQARDTFLPREAQSRLNDLNSPMQSRILNEILGNARVKYPFLQGARPITLITRTTVSLDPVVERRSHVKPKWPLGENMRWIEAESTKATFAQVTALQVLSEIIRQPDVHGKIALSEDAKAFLAALYQLSFLDEAGRPRENLLRLPEEFVLCRGNLTDDSDLAEMQLYALKRRLPFAMMEPFAISMATIEPELQIPMINWVHLENVDLRSIIPTPDYLRELAKVVSSQYPHKRFKSFRFNYSGERTSTSEEHTQAGLQLLRALSGNNPGARIKSIAIDALEIDRLSLTLEDEAQALLDIIINSALKKLTLTGFSTSINLKKIFPLSLDVASALKSVRILFQGVPSNETVNVLLASFSDAPELREFIFSHNHLGEILRGQDQDRNFKHLYNFVKKSEKLMFLDLSNNGLFTGPEDQYKYPLFDAIDEYLDLETEMRGNNLSEKDEKIARKKYYRKEILSIGVASRNYAVPDGRGMETSTHSMSFYIPRIRNIIYSDCPEKYSDCPERDVRNWVIDSHQNKIIVRGRNVYTGVMRDVVLRGHKELPDCEPSRLEEGVFGASEIGGSVQFDFDPGDNQDLPPGDYDISFFVIGKGWHEPKYRLHINVKGVVTKPS